MNLLDRRLPAAALLSAALAVLLVSFLGREARAEKLYTERPAELRASPGDDSQVVRRVSKGKSLEVIRRLGTWVMVEYEGRKGWIRRTALSTEPVSADGAGAEEKSDKAEKADKDKKDGDRKKDDAADAGSETQPKAAAAGAKRTAAKRKAERRKSRKSRHEVDEDGDEAGADEEGEEDEQRRPRSTWAGRSRLPGGPLKVEIRAISVDAFSEPDGTGKVVFTASEGERVRVIARGENRWLLVENSKKRTGWIPAHTVRDNGKLPEARKDVSKARRDDAGEAEEAPGAEEETVAETGGKGKATKSKGKTRTAAASFEDDGGETGEAEDARKAREAEDAALDSSVSGEDMTARPWSFTAGLRGGFTAIGMDVSPTGATAQSASYAGPAAGLTGEFGYRFRPKLAVLTQLDYDFSTAVGGLAVTPDGGAELDAGSVQSHRIGLSAGVGYGKRVVGSVRVGFQYAAFLVSDIDNEASWPRESTVGPTAGLGLAYGQLAGTRLGLKLGVDALLFGSRSQTEGRTEGEFDSMTALAASLRLNYPIGKSLLVDGGYRFGYTTASWTGTSDRTGATETERTDLAHEISVGVGWRL